MHARMHARTHTDGCAHAHKHNQTQISCHAHACTTKTCTHSINNSHKRTHTHTPHIGKHIHKHKTASHSIKHQNNSKFSQQYNYLIVCGMSIKLSSNSLTAIFSLYYKFYYLKLKIIKIYTEVIHVTTKIDILKIIYNKY